MLSIVINLVFTIFNSPLQNQNDPLILFASYSNDFMTCLFFLEFIFKIIVYGVIINGPKSYFMRGLNIFEFFILIASLVSVGFNYRNNIDYDYIDNDTNLHIVQGLRVLCIARILTKNETLRITSISIVYAMYEII